MGNIGDKFTNTSFFIRFTPKEKKAILKEASKFGFGNRAGAYIRHLLKYRKRLISILFPKP